MTELFSGLCFCDLESKDSGEGYNMQFNAGRLVAGLLIITACGLTGGFVI